MVIREINWINLYSISSKRGLIIKMYGKKNGNYLCSKLLILLEDLGEINKITPQWNL